MHFLLAIAVTLSFFAGQTCGAGMSTFRPPAQETEGEVMSRLVVRCGGENTNVSSESNADCGPGQCLAHGAKEEPDAAATTAASGDISLPDVASVTRPQVRLIALHESSMQLPSTGRMYTVVRRE